MSIQARVLILKGKTQVTKMAMSNSMSIQAVIRQADKVEGATPPLGHRESLSVNIRFTLDLNFAL